MAQAAACDVGSGTEARGWSVLTTFDIVVVRTGRAAVMHVRGELDLSTAPQLDEKVASLVDEGVLDVTVDLTDLAFIDSSGLRALVCGLKRLRKQGGDLELRSPTPSTRKVLEITGLLGVFRLEPSEGAGFFDTSADRATMPTAGGPATVPTVPVD